MQRMIAVLLSTVLVVGTAEGAVPVNVLAKESVSGNELEITEEGTGAESVGEETKTEPGTEETGWENMEEPGTEEADQEDMEGNVTEEPKQEPMELVTEAEDSEDVGEIDNDEPGYDIDTNQWSLVIKSDTGMANWCKNRGNYRYYNIRTIEIEKGVTYIGEDAFYECESLVSITIPSGVNKIEARAFYSCGVITDIKLPNTVTSIGAEAFYRCTQLKEIKLPDTVTSIGNGAFNNCFRLESIEIPGGVTEIAAATFAYCSGLKSITMPEDVASIGSSAFTGCKALESIEIPSGVTEIAAATFKDCIALTSITIPDSVTSIGSSAFYGCSALTGITIPDSVTRISEHAFHDCSALTSITIPEGVTSIANFIFKACSSLEKVTIPDSVTSIGMEAFEKCISLTSIEIPSNVNTILNEAFMDCSSLESVIVQPITPPTIAIDVFTGCKFVTERKKGIIVPTESVNQYKSKWSQWSSYITDSSADSSEAKVRKAIEAALQEIKVTNATTEDDLKTAIDEALKEAGIDSSNVTIEVEDFEKTKATISVDGKITGTIKFQIGDINGTVNVNQTINQLENTPAARVAVTKEIVEEVLGGIEVTNDTTKEDLETAIDEALKAALQEVGIDGSSVTATVGELTVTPATVDTEGSVTGTITITSDDAIDTVDVNKTIEKLSGTPAEKVEAAKETVETVLRDIKVSNDTTEDDLKEAIDKALKEAGIDSSVTVTVGELTVTPATVDTEGSVTGTITITSGDVTDTVDVNQTIKKLPGTPAAKVEAAKEALEDAVKKAVEEAVKGIVVTDDNAEDIKEQVVELLPEVIVKALDGTGVSLNDIELGEVEVDINSATADSEGSIRVTIPVISTEDPEQTVNAEVLVTTVRDEDAEKAQELIEDAIKDITVSNETTEEDILKEIQDALGDDAVIEGIEEFEKVEATQDAPGSLTLKIRVTVNGKTVYVTVNVPIAKLDIRTGVYVRFTDYDKLDDSSTPCYKYTGAAIKPAVEVYNNETLLTLGTDYTIKYRENTKPGNEAGLSVKGKGSFTGGSRQINFTIIPADIDKDTDHPTKMTVVAGTKVAPVIMNGAKKLTTKDYKLEGDGLKNGKYASATADGKPNILTVTGIGGYEGSSFTIKVTVIKKSEAGKLAVTVDKNFKPVYDGSALNLSSLFKTGTGDEKGVITVTDSKDKTKILKEGTDFTAVCTSSLSSAGTVKFTVTGMGAYAGSVSKTFKISPLKVTDSSKFSVTFEENKAYEYKASGATVDNLVVKYLGGTGSAEDDKVLMQGVDYKVTYSNNKKVSGSKDASLKVTFLGNYKGSSAVTKTFKVVTAKLSAANTKVIIPDKVYGKANKAYKSTPIVAVNGTAIKASNYTVSYAWATASEAGDDTKYVTDNKVKVTIAEGDSYARVKVTVTPKQTGSYGLADGAAIIGEYYVRKADNAVNLSKARLVTFHSKAGTELKKLEYNGKAFYTPEGNDANAEGAPDDPNAVYVRVLVGNKIVDPSLYDVEWTNATAKGKATVVIRGKGITTVKGTAVGSKNKTISIKSMVLSGKDLRTYMDKAASAVNRLRDMLFKKQ